jgi:hypothetical protein
VLPLHFPRSSQVLAQSMVRIKVMVFNTTFNNIPVISWWSVLLVEETGVPGENLSEFHKVVSSTPRHERDTNSQL